MQNETKRWISRIAAGFALASVLAPGGARADAETQYGFYPGSVLGLGQGFSPNDLSQGRLQCLDFSPRDVDSGPTQLSFSYTLARSFHQIKDTLNIDSKVEGSFLAGKASATFNFGLERDYSGDSISLVIMASAQYPRRTLSDAKLIGEAKRLIDEGRMSEFSRLCGTHFVSTEERWSMVSAIITFSNLSDRQKIDLGVGAEGSSGMGPASASMMLKIRTMYENLRQTSGVTIRVVGSGGDGLSALKDFVTTTKQGAESIEQIEGGMKTFLEKFSSQNAAPFRFYTMGFGWGFDPNGIDLWNQQRQRKLEKLVSLYRAALDRRDEVERIVEKEDPRYRGFDATGLANLGAYVGESEDYLDAVATAHEACRKTQALDRCDPPADPRRAIALPALPADPFFLANPRARGATYRGQLEFDVWDPKRVELTVNGRAIATWERFAVGLNSMTIDLEPYDRAISLYTRENVVGAVRIVDAYGRTFVRVFHRRMNSPNGGLPGVYEWFDREGSLL